VPATAQRRQNQYQPPLPGTTDPHPAPAAAVRPRTGEQSWRLDEKTRRAGRRGVALARAALATAVRPGDERQANAA
jgi:hypothetical protein